VSDNEVHLQRNPQFHSVDPAVRPETYPDEIVWISGLKAVDQLAKVESGQADYMAEQIPADAFAKLRTDYTPQLHVALGSTTYLFMNTTRAPFDKLDVRKAVSLAVDRAHVVELRGGSVAAQTTCQVLPPNFPGYEPYCPYTKDPNPSGRWSAPDLGAARRLVAASGTTGMKLVVGPMPARLTPLAQYVTGVLRDLGYDATPVIPKSPRDVFEALGSEKGIAIGGFEYQPDFPAAETFLAQFMCQAHDLATRSCDADLDALVAHARELQSVDPAAANHTWAEVDRKVIDLALWAPLVNEGSDFVSARLGNYQFEPASGILLDQAWVQ
jgi:peptide/nickel transport system substrate-binding protein